MEVLHPFPVTLSFIRNQQANCPTSMQREGVEYVVLADERVTLQFYVIYSHIINIL